MENCRFSLTWLEHSTNRRLRGLQTRKWEQARHSEACWVQRGLVWSLRLAKACIIGTPEEERAEGTSERIRCPTDLYELELRQLAGCFRYHSSWLFCAS